MLRRLPVAILLLVLGAVTLACSAGSGASPSASDVASGHHADAITVTDAWARPSASMEVAGAAYLTITNAGAEEDVLLSASTPAAGVVEIHQTMAEASGMMAMHPVDSLPIPAGGSVALEPGGYHLMLINLTGELVVGESIELTLVFEHAGERTVTAEVRAS